MTWFERNAARLAFAAVVIVLVLALFGVSQCQRKRAAQAGTNVAQGQTGAAVQSGADAVTTLGNQQAAEQELDAATQERADAIFNLQDAGKAVGDSTADGWHALMCKRASYRNLPECVQRAPAP